jgi:hypothetical protein
MKNLLLSILLVSLAAVVGCSNNDSTTNPGNTTGTGKDSYFPIAVGNSWVYKTQDSTATRTITGTTTFSGKTYFQVMDYSEGTSGMIRRDGAIVYAMLPSDFFGTLKEVTQLNETVGASWSYDLTVLDSQHFAFNTVAAGLTHTTNGDTYTDVLKVHQHVTGSVFGSAIDEESDIYYAKGVGLIEDQKNMLRSYTIK